MTAGSRVTPADSWTGWSVRRDPEIPGGGLREAYRVQPWGVRRGSQGASRAAPGKSGFHARAEGERVIALESRDRILKSEDNRVVGGAGGGD